MYDLIIIGAGPAGLTAGIYAGRFRLKTLILEKMAPGGQIILSEWIDNYPGFPGGVATAELMERFKKQVDELGVVFVTAQVNGISIAGSEQHPSYKLSTENGEFETKSVILATGARSRGLGLEREAVLVGRGVSYCATCDGPLYKDKEVVVVGGGDKAVEEALFLTRYCRKVYLVHRKEQFRASKILQEQAQANSKIQFIMQSTVQALLGDTRIKAVKLKNVATGIEHDLPCEGLFIFVGIIPNTDFIKNQLQTDGHGFIIAGQDMHTSLPGVFACGDCKSKSLYQVVNACGDGAVAANSAHKYLMESK